MADTLQARKLSLSVLHDVQRGKESVDIVFERAFAAASGIDARDRAFAMSLVMTVLRYLPALDALLASYLQKPLDPKKLAYVQDVLRLGAAQLLLLDVPPHAAVHSSVELIKNSKFKGFAKLTNGVLQSIARTGKDNWAGSDVPRLVTPDWLWNGWVRDWGEISARRIAQWNLHEPSLDITVKSDGEFWAGKLGGHVLPTGSVRLKDAQGITHLPGFAEGEWWVQDAAAAIPAKLLGDLSGKKVLDLCAAPGGKTAQLALAGGQVTAVDRSPHRLKRVQENLSRLKLQAEIQPADILTWSPKTAYDAILLDAPCSATGTIRRHPDLALRKGGGDVRELAELQSRMLSRALDWLSPGGELVYCTCSIEKTEGENHIEAVLKARQDVTLVPVQAVQVGGLGEIVTSEGYIRTHPYHMEALGGMDGFFAAKLIKVPL